MIDLSRRAENEPASGKAEHYPASSISSLSMEPSAHEIDSESKKHAGPAFECQDDRVPQKTYGVIDHFDRRAENGPIGGSDEYGPTLSNYYLSEKTPTIVLDPHFLEQAGFENPEMDHSSGKKVAS